jgi:hypothetical protein
MATGVSDTTPGIQDELTVEVGGDLQAALNATFHQSRRQLL